MSGELALRSAEELMACQRFVRDAAAANAPGTLSMNRKHKVGSGSAPARRATFEMAFDRQRVTMVIQLEDAARGDKKERTHSEAYVMFLSECVENVLLEKATVAEMIEHVTRTIEERERKRMKAKIRNLVIGIVVVVAFLAWVVFMIMNSR